MLKVSLNNGKELLYELTLEELCYKITNKIAIRSIGESAEIKMNPKSVSGIMVLKDKNL